MKIHKVMISLRLHASVREEHIALSTTRETDNIQGYVYIPECAKQTPMRRSS